MSPSSSAPQSAFFVARIAAGEFRAIVSASVIAAAEQLVGRVDDLAEDPELVGPRRPTAARAGR